MSGLSEANNSHGHRIAFLPKGVLCRKNERTMNTLIRRNSGNLLAYALLFALAVIASFASMIR